MTFTKILPKAFLWRRLHSLTGLWLVLYLIEHLLVNSRAALLVGDDTDGFINSVNAIHELPYLLFIEIFLLGVPVIIHAFWGVKYLFTARYNSASSNGSAPSLPEYPRNRAYTWQRVTSWILLFGIAAHVVHMRFVEYPDTNDKGQYLVRITPDDSMQILANRLNVTYEKKDGYTIAVAPNFGTAELLVVRETFKMPLMIALYTILVLTACFHAFNGLWTFMISWGVTLNSNSQKIMRTVATTLMILVSFLGLMAIWGNLLNPSPASHTQHTAENEHHGT